MAFPKGLLSDLGGVIVPWVGLIELSHITGKCEAEIKAVMGASAFLPPYKGTREAMLKLGQKYKVAC